MTLKYLNWTADPATNNAAPPVGAPEGTTRYKHVNDILRYVMAAVFEVGTLAQATEDSLGSMAGQDDNAVDINGGTISATTLDATNHIPGEAIDSGTVSAARLPTVNNAAKLGGLTLQQIYDVVNYVGKVEFTLEHLIAYPVPAGVTATWLAINTARYIKIVDDASYTGTELVPQFGGTTAETSLPAGGHNHGGATGAHVLTTAEMPAHRHSYGGGINSVDNVTGYRSGGTEQNDEVGTTSITGGGDPHTHTISTIADHTHTVPMDPAFIAMQAWRRTA